MQEDRTHGIKATGGGDGAYRCHVLNAEPQVLPVNIKCRGCPIALCSARSRLAGAGGTATQGVNLLVIME